MISSSPEYEALRAEVDRYARLAGEAQAMARMLSAAVLTMPARKDAREAQRLARLTVRRLVEGAPDE